MTTCTPSDFCQGHGGGRDCTYVPEVDGCLQHGDDFDHGIVSYCDGTCAEAREHYLRYLVRELGQQPVGVEGVVTLEAYGQGVSYQVTFEGREAESRALAYMSAHKGLAFAEVEDRPNYWPALSDAFAEALYPQCHHGLALELCMDPYGDAHFGTREQELSRGW